MPHSRVNFLPPRTSEPIFKSCKTALKNKEKEMVHRLLARSLWPLGMALQTSVVVVAGWFDPGSVGRAMGLTTVGFLLALLGLEQALPYRQEWSAVTGKSGAISDTRSCTRVLAGTLRRSCSCTASRRRFPD